jgi:hypothetical protein
MVTIPQYVAGNLLNPASAPRVSADTSGADAMARAGNALMGLGASIDAERERQGLKAQADLEQQQDQEAKFWMSRVRADAVLWDQRTRTELARSASADNPDWSQTYAESWKAYEKQVLGSAPNEQAKSYWQTWAPGFNAGALGGEGGVIASVETAKAAKRQTDFNTTLDKHLLAIVENPNDLDRVVARIEDDIDALAPFLAPGQETELKAKAVEAAKKTAREGIFRRDPIAFQQRIIGGTSVPAQTNDARTIMGRLIPAESSGNPNAVSPKGAAGLAQVMPSTAPEIARELGDQNFPFNNPEQIREYLKDPEVSVRYGTHYLQKQLDRYGGETKAALIAYNAGPKRADEWLQSGRNDAVLPAETRDYVGKIMGGGASAALDLGPDTQLDAGTFKSRHYTWQDLRNDRWSTSTVSSRAVTALDWVTDQFGSKLKITSGYRAPNHPAESAKARPGQHTHGQAIDIDVSGMSDADKSRLVALFVQAGARGLGHYPPGSGGAGTIHVDFRAGRGKQPDGLALWYGSQPYANGEAWFKAGIDQGRQAGPAMGAGGTGGVPPGIASDPLFQGATPEEVWGYVDKANQVVDEQRKAMAAAETARLAALKDSFSLQIATGQPLSQNDILASDLGDGDKASLINTLNERTKNTRTAADYIARVNGGGGVNPFSEEDRKGVNLAFDAEGGASGLATGDQTAYERASRYIRETGAGMLPSSAAAELKAGMYSTNPTRMDQALTTADRLYRENPDAFARGMTEADLSRVQDWQALRRFRTPEEMAEHFRKQSDPSTVRAREELTKQALKDAATTYDLNKVLDLFDPGIMAGEPEAPLDPMAAGALVQDFHREYADRFAATGDKTMAEQQAMERIKRVWGPSPSAGNRMMRYPPESFYPPVDGSFDWIKQDLDASVSEKFGPDAVADLMSDERTEAELKTGAPSYGLIARVEGVPMLVGRWKPEGSPFLTQAREEFVKRDTAIREDSRIRELEGVVTGYRRANQPIPPAVTSELDQLRAKAEQERPKVLGVIPVPEEEQPMLGIPSP